MIESTVGKLASALKSDERLGLPSFTDKQTATDPGMFAMIYGGACDALQPFVRREIEQYEIVTSMTYVRSFLK